MNRFEEREEPIRKVVQAMRYPEEESSIAIAAKLPPFDSKYPDHQFQSAISLRLGAARERGEINWMQFDWSRYYLLWLFGRTTAASIDDKFVKLDEKYVVAEIVLETAEHILNVLATEGKKWHQSGWKFTRDHFYGAVRERIEVGATS